MAEYLYVLLASFIGSFIGFVCGLQRVIRVIEKSPYKLGITIRNKDRDDRIMQTMAEVEHDDRPKGAAQGS